MKPLLALLLTTCSLLSSPNVVLILVDDLGWTDLPSYGFTTYHETPALDRLASQGMRFTSAYSSAKCQASRACIQSGQSAPRTGIYNVGSREVYNWLSGPITPVENIDVLALEKVTIGEALKAGGYWTGLFGKWHLGVGDYHPANQGYDEAIMTPQGKYFNFSTTPVVPVIPGTYLPDLMTDLSLDFIERNKERPFFLVLDHYAPHLPYEAKPELVSYFESKPNSGGPLTNAVYAAILKSIDESVERVISKLEALNLATNTLVVFMSDNGGTRGFENSRNSPLRHGKGTYYEGGIRVPAIFYMPGRIPAGTVSDVPINAVDLYPTLLEIAGVQPPPGYPLDGTSYADVLTGDGTASAPRPPLFWHFPSYESAGQETPICTPLSAIRDGDWKLMEFFIDGHLELYNLADDLGEQTNMASDNPEKATELYAKLDLWRQSLNAYIPTNHGLTNIAPYITIQPVDRSISPGQISGFRVYALSTEPMTYEWFCNGVPIPNSNESAPETTNVLAGTYYVIISNQLGSVQSSNVTLRIGGPPVITTHPVDIATRITGPATFIIELDSYPISKYQWFFNGELMPGKTGRSLFMPACQHNMAGQYWVTASNAYGLVTSQPATLTILDPWVYTQPQSTNVYAGQKVSFYVTSLSTPPTTHQWYFNGQPMLNATNRGLTILNANAFNAGQYQLYIESAHSNVWSDVATVEVRLVGPMEQFSGFRIYAPTGTVATVEYTLDLVNWNVLTNLTIPTYPFLFIDQEPLDPQRFYRAVLAE